jgi:hypothetical protein
VFGSDFKRHIIHTTSEWASILTIADKWEFKSIRDRAIEELDELGTALDKIVYGKKFGVSRWLEAAYIEICERAVPLTEEEGERMEAKDIVRIASTRERFLREPRNNQEERKRIVREVFQLHTTIPTKQLGVTSDALVSLGVPTLYSLT